MTAKSMMPYIEGSSAIREMFEAGARMAAQFGEENVYDFSLGNPSIPAPPQVEEAIRDILETEDPLHLHGYNKSNSGYEDVRSAVAARINKSFDFSKRPKGTYTYKVVIKAINGALTKNFTFSKTFTVK